MKYISTRGQAPVLGFEDVLLAGLARDGGLYVPENWPKLSESDIAALAGKPYAQIACSVMAPFVGEDVPTQALREMADAAYAQFEHPAIAPLIQIGENDWLLELFHGPTLAFKDFAMQMVSRLMDRALRNRGQRATLIGATSGDTGGAAIEAFRGLDAIDIFILHPHGRVSEVQRRQMTTAVEGNVHNIALEGTFDDCQALVKALFNDLDLRDRLGLAGVNSINWARILVQVVYYFSAAASLGAPHRSVRFTVPTGNFGDIFAGFVAQQMGLPISRLVIATNSNDILARTVHTGCYALEKVVATQSPSMDIQVSSNFERLLFELTRRNSQRLLTLMENLRDKNVFQLSDAEHKDLQAHFSAHRVSESEMAQIVKNMYETSAYIADPHTAVGLFAAQREVELMEDDAPMITLATAHPAKFPESIETIIGVSPKRPERLSRQFGMEERYQILPNDFSALSEFICAHARTVQEAL